MTNDAINKPGIQKPTQIPGQADWDPCLKKAAMLILDIYEYEDDALTPALRQKKKEIWDHWEIGWFEDRPSGLYCKMYYPKITNGMSPLDACPPVLAFRGSEMEEHDIAEIAVHVEADFYYHIKTLFKSWEGPWDPMIPTVSPSSQYAAMKTREELLNAGLREQPLIKKTSGYHEVMGGVPKWGLEMVRAGVDWTFSASLFYGENGDWPTNIAQALGDKASQYEEAAEIARQATDEAMQNWNGRLMILGHSLGGGLASLAALVAKARHKDLQVRCDIYNAAGLHEETAEKAKVSLSDAASAGIRSRQVSGDLLTLLQTKGAIPLVSDVFRWAGVTLPPAIPTSSPSQGISPGGNPSMMFTGWERSPEWAILPALLPLRRQNLVECSFNQLSLLFIAAAHAPNPRIFVENAIDALFDAFGNEDKKVKPIPALVDTLLNRRKAEKQFYKIKPFFIEAVNSPPPIPTEAPLDFGYAGYTKKILVPTINEAILDTIAFTHIMKATVDYHMWDACAYTFLLDRKD